MKVAIVGASGSIGGMIMQQTLLRSDISEVIAITRKPLSSPDPRLHNVTIPDFGNLDAISDSTWLQISGADALVWAMGSYTFDDDVNLKFPLAFQEALARRMGAREGNPGLSDSSCSAARSRKLISHAGCISLEGSGV